MRAGEQTHDLEVLPSCIGASEPMQRLHRLVRKVARCNSTVLIRGESGAGKELIARMLYRQGLRSKGPFVAVNCAALPESLAESELFGHERGAFTGAVIRKLGKFELAEGGTLFLDEVGDLPLGIQPKLLRAVQEREIDRLGGSKPIRVDVRLIAATNRNLEKAVAAGQFREDLFFRLRILTLRVPPLRERPEDIPALVHHFALKHAEFHGRSVRGVAPETIAILQKLSWPGNVRHLESAIESAVVLGETELLLPADLPPEIFNNQPSGASGSMDYHAATLSFQCQHVQHALELAAYDYKEAARLLNLHPKSMHKLLSKFELTHLLERSPNAIDGHATPEH